MANDNKPVILGETAAAQMQEMWQWYQTRKDQTFRAGRTRSPIPTPRAIIAKTPGGGIAARSGKTPGSATCDIFYIDTSGTATLTDSTYNETVYNLTDTAIPGDAYIHVGQERYGKFVVDTSAGGGDDECCENICQDDNKTKYELDFASSLPSAFNVSAGTASVSGGELVLNQTSALNPCLGSLETSPRFTPTGVSFSIKMVDCESTGTIPFQTDITVKLSIFDTITSSPSTQNILTFESRDNQATQNHYKVTSDFDGATPITLSSTPTDGDVITIKAYEGATNWDLQCLVNGTAEYTKTNAFAFSDITLCTTRCVVSANNDSAAALHFDDWNQTYTYI